MTVNVAKKFWDGFDRLLKMLANVGMILLFLMLVSVCWEVFSRYFLGQGTSWVIEFSEYSILFMTFLGGPWLLKKNGHVEMDIVVNGLQPNARQKLGVVSSLVCALLCAVLAWSGADVALDYLQRGLHRPSLLAPPYFPLFAVIPISFFLFAIQFVRRAQQFLLAPDSATKKERGLM
jgi:TRAP-type C4-dicarboxylate transport system permease small subunit